VLTLVLACMAQAAEGLSAYLPKVGPSPLRFQPPPRRVVPLTLPSLAMADPAPPQAQPRPGPSPFEAPTKVEESPPDLWETFLADAINPAPDPAVTALPREQAPTEPPVAPPPPNVTPQMLVKFFNQPPGASNRVGGEFLVPPGFFRPATPPGGGASSTATYTTPK